MLKLLPPRMSKWMLAKFTDPGMKAAALWQCTIVPHSVRTCVCSIMGLVLVEGCFLAIEATDEPTKAVLDISSSHVLAAA